MNKKGTDKLYTENYFNSSLSGELSFVSGNLYNSKIENGEFLKYEFINNSWVATDKSGTKYKFGINASSRQDDPSNTSKVYRWYLEEVRDTNNNYIKYEYFKDQGQIYPAKIYYTGNNITDGIFQIEFLRETRTDTLTSFKTTFSVKTNYRINEIQAKVNGAWTRKYALGYINGDNSIRSIFSTITESGKDEGGIVTVLPVTKFEYQKNTTKNWTYDPSWTLPIEPNGFYKDKALVLSDPNNLKDLGAREMEINGDGLIDFVKSRIEQTAPGINSYETKSAIYINNSHGWTLDASLVLPLEVNGYNINKPLAFLSNTNTGLGVRIADVNGDGLNDFIKSKEENAIIDGISTFNTISAIVMFY